MKTYGLLSGALFARLSALCRDAGGDSPVGDDDALAAVYRRLIGVC
ncbi:hypothetical protein [Candidatus Nitrotoga sp. HW29]|nr:hypothetical protein [Candidatus Nitrotoga sp. HW29]